jgi:hypothetical protein
VRLDGFYTGSTTVVASTALPVPMRANPTLAIANNTSVNVSGLGFGVLNNAAVFVSGTAGSGGNSLITTFTASADL